MSTAEWIMPITRHLYSQCAADTPCCSLILLHLHTPTLPSVRLTGASFFQHYSEFRVSPVNDPFPHCVHFESQVSPLLMRSLIIHDSKASDGTSTLFLQWNANLINIGNLDNLLKEAS